MITNFYDYPREYTEKKYFQTTFDNKKKVHGVELNLMSKK